ncbi:hypothetical protein GCM10023183_19940 [Nibribacter koreensis]|uniref:DUF6438 domain-containing protein n=1 Tax=Nibribacter koreensis TaxID=1084519 RepID=A0ABP8FKI9_9BACT
MLLGSCQEQQPDLRIPDELYGDWVPVGYQIIIDSLSIKGGYSDIDLGLGIPEVGFTFMTNGLVDTKAGFYKYTAPNETGKRRALYIGSESVFHVQNDTLRIFNPTDSTWILRTIYKLNRDTLSFFHTEEIVCTFIKKNFNLETAPKFDKIIVSTSGCYGSCPISSTMIESNGQVTFYGERYTSKLGTYHGKISRARYLELQKKFQKADLSNIGTHFSDGVTDNEELTVTFIRGDSIYKTITDYAHSGPLELRWALHEARNLYQTVQLKPIAKGNKLFSTSISFLYFSQGENKLRLSQSEGYLLWDYLRKGTITEKEFQSRFKLGFYKNNLWVPSGEETNQWVPFGEEPILQKDDANNVKEISTDGRYFKFVRQHKPPVTIDVGFNFFERNFSIKVLKPDPKEEPLY